ncbi:MAG: pilin [Elusimicrobiaceae bacterium]|nr:pilin [Elusimicrobiaceae bacterium]
MSRKAFTLIELLIVVLIIGILSAIAIPMYQGAVDKSHWSTMLPGAKAIKDAEEAFKMSNDGYTSEMGNLDVTMENNDLTFNLITPNNTSDPNVIRVTNSKLANVRLASYLDDNPKFAGQLHCEAATGDERANRLCGGLLQGQELTSADGYVGYLLDQEIDQGTCQNASRSWSTSKTKCYKTTAERCEALGMGVVASMDDQCGYENITNQTVGVEGTCISTVWGGCDRSKVSGGVIWCNGNSTNCGNSSTVTNGGVCVDNGVSNVNCYNVQFTNGSICYENSGNGCIASTYDSTSCCCGKHCPSNAPKCSDRGITCDPQYMK